MASGKSNYLNNKILNYIFNAGTFTQPTGLQCALYTVAPTASTAGTEVSGGSYARQSISVTSTANFLTTTTQTITNVNPIIFTPAASASWGTVLAAAFFDQGGTNMLYFGTMTGVAVASGNTFEFLAGNFTVTEA
jgi:hypothetical protein